MYLHSDCAIIHYDTRQESVVECIFTYSDNDDYHYHYYHYMYICIYVTKTY